MKSIIILILQIHKLDLLKRKWFSTDAGGAGDRAVWHSRLCNRKSGFGFSFMARLLFFQRQKCSEVLGFSFSFFRSHFFIKYALCFYRDLSTGSRLEKKIYPWHLQYSGAQQGWDRARPGAGHATEKCLQRRTAFVRASGVQKDILAEGMVRGFGQEAGAEKWGWGVRAEHWNRSH